MIWWIGYLVLLTILFVRVQNPDAAPRPPLFAEPDEPVRLIRAHHCVVLCDPPRHSPRSRVSGWGSPGASRRPGAVRGRCRAVPPGRKRTGRLPLPAGESTARRDAGDQRAVPARAPSHVPRAGLHCSGRATHARLAVGALARAAGRWCSWWPVRCSRTRPWRGRTRNMPAGRPGPSGWFRSCSEPGRQSISTLRPRTNSASEPSLPMHTVAVDILTGFLGSGKTTLLRHVLDHGLRGKPVAVIMNEIGEIGIDGRVVTGLSAVEKMVELSSGCICCTIDDYRFDLAVQEIIETTRPHLIIIESTGLADPEPLVDRVKAAGLGLDAIITVVDAEAAPRHLRETGRCDPTDRGGRFHRAEQARPGRRGGRRAGGPTPGAVEPARRALSHGAGRHRQRRPVRDRRGGVSASGPRGRRPRASARGRLHELRVPLGGPARSGALRRPCCRDCRATSCGPRASCGSSTATGNACSTSRAGGRS